MPLRSPSLRSVPFVGLLAVVAGGTVAAPTGATADGTGNATLDAAFEPGSTTAGANATLLVNASDDRAVVVSSPDLTDAELAETVAGTPVEEGVRANVSDGAVTVRFPERFECRTGEYAFTVTGADTGATANASVDLVAPGELDLQFTQSSVAVQPARTARIPIESRCPRTVRVEVGSRSSGFLANTTVHVDRGRNELLLDTNETADPGGLFRTGPNATLRNVSLAEPAEEPLATGEYDLRLSAGGGETDAALLRVTENPRTATPTPSPTSEPTRTATASPSPAPTPSPTVPPTSTATPTAPPTPTTTTAGGTLSPTVSPTASPAGSTTTEDGTTTTDGQPGFGVPSAVVLLLAVAVRRRTPE